MRITEIGSKPDYTVLNTEKLFKDRIPAFFEDATHENQNEDTNSDYFQALCDLRREAHKFDYKTKEGIELRFNYEQTKYPLNPAFMASPYALPNRFTDRKVTNSVEERKTALDKFNNAYRNQYAVKIIRTELNQRMQQCKNT